VRQARVNYDAIAHLYDATPHRAKPVDPELISFVEQCSSDEIAVLDIGCGTGNQLIANRGLLKSSLMVGIDRFAGMLRQAQIKAAEIAWVQADGSILPFHDQSFDIVSCQFVFHHIANKSDCLRDVFRVLKPGGRFALRNVSPHDCPDWLFYVYFPEASAIDLQDFWSPETIRAEMEQAGFVALAIDRQHIGYRQDMRAWFDEVRTRETCSQLLAIPDAAYQAGLDRLTQELARHGGSFVRQDHVCLATIKGEKPKLMPTSVRRAKPVPGRRRSRADQAI
jgi:ubiquinone/menaquinone biosynthesis C-methylase UbiE